MTSAAARVSRDPVRWTARRAVGHAVTGGLREALRGRALLAIVAIAFGVALGYAVELVNHAAISELASGLAVVAGKADLEVRGPRAGFHEALYPALARDRDVEVASPVVEVLVKIRGDDEPLDVLGVDVFRAMTITPALVAIGRDRFDTLRDDTLFPSPAAARALGVDVGDRVVVQSGLRDVPLRVAGHAGEDRGARYAVMDIAAVQDRFDREGRLTRIDLRLRPGANADVVRQRLQTSMPPGVNVVLPSTSAEATTRFSRAYRVNLNVLALVALFTGAMLVYATQTLAAVRRRPQFALLRTLGLSRRRLVSWVITEGALLGAIGAALGLAAGYAIASLALARFGPDLGAGFFAGGSVKPAPEPVSLAIFAALGIAAAVLASALPAREAARAAPAAALKAVDADVLLPAATRGIAWIAIAVGVGAAFLPTIDDLPIAGYVAIALILTGGILAIPSLAQAALRRIALPRRSPAIALALSHLRATPGRFAAMLAAVVASVALMVSMAIMVASFRQSLDDWLRVVLPADLYLRAFTDSAYLSAHDQQAIAAIPGVARAEFMRVTSISLDPARPSVALLARDIDPQDAGARIALVGRDIVPRASAPPPVWVSEAVADIEHVSAGDTIALPVGGHSVDFTVAGVFRDYARQQGSIVVERARYRALTGDDAVNEAALWLAPSASLAAVHDAIAAYAGGAHVRAETPAALRELSLATFDRTFAVTYALEAAAVLIGLVGLSAALAAQTLARSREFGMLRHVGMTRRQIGAMLALEGSLLAAIGVVAGLVQGFAVSLILIHVVNRQSFHWGMSLHVPWLSLALLALVLLALATLVAAASARRATGIAAVRAVREDW